jgi:DNA polymerase-1
MKTLLLDADIIAYQAAAVNETNIDWGDGVTSHDADLDAAKDTAAFTIQGIKERLEADAVIVCLSDDFDNFRKRIEPTYKANRKSERPSLLYQLKDWLAACYDTARRPGLEADDVMGIMATEPHDGRRIIVSADKDMLTIPGFLYRPHLPDARVQHVTEAEADRYHLFQTLTGDATDGYPGCPGVGPVVAARALNTLTGVESYEHTFASGPRKGTSETRWRPALKRTKWEVVLSLFEKAGLGAPHAVKQARLARILRHTDWDGTAPILWKPGV